MLTKRNVGNMSVGFITLWVTWKLMVHFLTPPIAHGILTMVVITGILVVLNITGSKIIHLITGSLSFAPRMPKRKTEPVDVPHDFYE